MLTHRNVLWSILLLMVFMITMRAFFHFSNWVLLIPVLMYVVLTSYGSASVQAGFYVKTVNKGKTHEKKIALSFDDGPVVPFTHEVLDILKEKQIPATFFCIGKQIEQYPYVLKRIIAEGHLIGNHTFSHSYHMGFFTTKRVISEIETTDQLITKLTQRQPRWFRPPFGVTNPMIARALKKTGHQVIGWSMRSLDTVIKDKKRVVRRIIKQLRPGAIVLLHDRLPEISSILTDLLIEIEKEGYEIVSMEELLNLSAFKE